MEHNKQLKQLNAKISDFKNFAYVLLAVSVFLYIGVVIPEERTPFQLYTLMGSTLILLGLSFTFFILVIKYRKQVNEIEQ